MPASARELHVDGVVFRPLAGADVAAELYLAWRADNDNPALPVFNAMVERFLTESADEAGAQTGDARARERAARMRG